MSARKLCRWARSSRIRKRPEFLATQRGGRKVHGRLFIAIVGPGPARSGRLGITVSKRVGNAVTRNRIKRWVREYVRQQPADAWLPRGRDVVLIAKARAAHAGGYREIADDLAEIGAKL